MKILIIELSNLGDAILTFPALTALRAAFPQAELHVLASPRTRELFETDPRFRRVWLWHKGPSLLRQMALIRRLFFERFDRVVDFRHSLIPLFLLGAGRTPLLRWPNGSNHRVDQHLALLKGWGIVPSDGPAPLWVGPSDQRQVKEWLEPGRVPVVIAPGSRSHLKRWEAGKFAQVADRLVVEHQAQILLVGDEGERSVVEQVKQAMRQPFTDLTGRTTVPQLFALLAQSRMVITNDSACLHAAQAMGTPTVAIFGPTDERKYGPRLPDSVVVRRHLICAPCERALCPYGHECMRFLEPEEVYAAAIKVLSETSVIARNEVTKQSRIKNEIASLPLVARND